MANETWPSVVFGGECDHCGRAVWDRVALPVGTVCGPCAAVVMCAAVMRETCDTFDRALWAGADRAVLDPLRAAHNTARAAWIRARAAAGDGQAAVLVAMGAAD